MGKLPLKVNFFAYPLPGRAIPGNLIMDIEIHIPYDLYQAFIAAFAEGHDDAEKIKLAIESLDHRKFSNLRKYRIGYWLRKYKLTQWLDHEIQTQKDADWYSLVPCPACHQKPDFLWYPNGLVKLLCINPKCPVNRLELIGKSECELANRWNSRYRNYFDK